MKPLGFYFLSYLPMINEISGQITKKLIEQEFSYMLPDEIYRGYLSFSV